MQTIYYRTAFHWDSQSLQGLEGKPAVGMTLQGHHLQGGALLLPTQLGRSASQAGPQRQSASQRRLPKRAAAPAVAMAAQQVGWVTLRGAAAEREYPIFCRGSVRT